MGIKSIDGNRNRNSLDMRAISSNVSLLVSKGRFRFAASPSIVDRIMPADLMSGDALA